ncbi:Hypothetical predicted protein [Pelobates cultripes]|uniref:Uncharacterized protein n=1 Tax=Pelobates cultripes TaxID=61616 RepID=A0AAD1W8G3_PELCU|nr:Hypothetical predicted protein [Pelobates cultripes]
MDESFSEEQDILCSIFSPVLCFLSPDVSGSDCSSSSSSSGGSSSYIVEQPYFISLREEDPEEEFKLPQYSSNFVNKLWEKRHRWMDIPLKTRNSPKHTLVLDPLPCALLECSWLLLLRAQTSAFSNSSALTQIQRLLNLFPVK